MKNKNAGTKSCKTNPVARFNRRINRSAAFRDRKKAEKRGDSRYKTQYRHASPLFSINCLPA